MTGLYQLLLHKFILTPRWRQEGYSLGVRYSKVAAQKITKTVVETALRGGGGLVDTLRHSYSMGDLRGMEGSQIQYLPDEGDMGYGSDTKGYGGENRGYSGDSRGYRGGSRGHGGDARGYASDARGESRGYRGQPKGNIGYEGERRGYSEDRRLLSQSWHEEGPGMDGPGLWQEEEGTRRRQRSNTGSHLYAPPSRSGSQLHIPQAKNQLLAIEDSSAASVTKRRSAGPRPRQANSLYGTLPRSSRTARPPRQLPETPPVRRTWHGRENRDSDLGRTVSSSPVRKREVAKVARPVRRPQTRKEVKKEEEVEDFSMTYSPEAELKEEGRRQCDIS